MTIKQKAWFAVLSLIPLAIWLVIPPYSTIYEVAAYFLGGYAIRSAERLARTIG